MTEYSGKIFLKTNVQSFITETEERVVELVRRFFGVSTNIIGASYPAHAVDTEKIHNAQLPDSTQ